MIDLVLTLQVAFHIETKDFSHGKTKVLFHAAFKIDTVHSMDYLYRKADSRVLQKKLPGSDLVAHTFDPGTQEADLHSVRDKQNLSIAQRNTWTEQK